MCVCLCMQSAKVIKIAILDSHKIARQSAISFSCCCWNPLRCEHSAQYNANKQTTRFQPNVNIYTHSLNQHFLSITIFAGRKARTRRKQCQQRGMLKTELVVSDNRLVLFTSFPFLVSFFFAFLVWILFDWMRTYARYRSIEMLLSHWMRMVDILPKMKNILATGD